MIIKPLGPQNEELKRYLDLAGVIIVALDKNGTINFLNKKGHEILGYEENELLGKNWFEICLPETIREEVFDVFKELIRGKSNPVEFHQNTILTSTGKERIISWHNTVLYDDNKIIIGTLSSGEDITEIIKAEQLLRESENKFRDLYEEAPVAYLSIGSDKQIQKCNKAAERLLGYSKVELLSMDVFELYAKNQNGLEKAIKIFKKFLNGEEIRDEELQMRKKNGDQIWINLSVKPVLDMEGNVIASRSIVVDITERKKVESIIKESERKYRDLYNHSIMGIAVHEIVYNSKGEAKNYILTDINPQFEEILSLQKENIINKLATEVYNVENAPYLDTFANVAESMEPISFETYFPPMDKHFKISVFSPEKGKFVTTFDDISSKITTEKELKELTIKLEQKVKLRTNELRESEGKYRVLADQSQIGIFIIQDNQIKYINKTAAEIIGFTREEVENLSLEDFAKYIHPDDKNFMLEQALKKQEGAEENMGGYDFRFFNKKGDLIWGHNLSKTITYEGQAADLVTQVYITERKEIEQKLKKSEERLKKSEWEKNLILDSIAELIAYYDVNGTILWVNQAAGDSLNMQPDDMIGKKCYALWHGRNEVCDDCPIEKSIDSGSPRAGEIVTPDGRIWDMKGFPVKDEKGNVIGAVEVTSEITKLKKAEDKVRKVNERTELYRSIFAHDISNIFNNVKMAAELCKPHLNDPAQLEEIRKLHRIISEQIIRGDKLIKNVKRLSSLEESKFPVKRQHVRQIIENSIEFLNNSYPNREIIINKEIANGSIIANVNELLQDVFENILFNAVKHNKSPRVEITLVVSKLKIEKRKFIKLEFKDNGKGISDKRKQLIFQRGKDLAKKKGGMGLGLSLVKKIIDSYAGKIWVEDRVKDEYKKGSNIIILIPEAT